jgi:hypothetical protein
VTFVGLNANAPKAGVGGYAGGGISGLGLNENGLGPGGGQIYSDYETNGGGYGVYLQIFYSFSIPPCIST